MDINNLNINIKELTPRYQIHTDKEFWGEIKTFADKRQIQINKLLLIAIALGLDEIERKENNGELKIL